MAIFKKEESEDNQKNDPQVENYSRTNSSTGKDVVLLQKDLETLKALVNTLREMKHDDQERFQKMNEQIGELRNMLFEKEQDLKDLKIQVVKAIDLVSQAQVEKVLVEKKKEDARITMLDARIESYKALADQMMNEIKNIRNTIDMYKGVEQVIALNNEVKRNLTNTSLLKADIDRHADMIEGMFVNFNKRYNEFRDSKVELVAMGRELQGNIMKTNKIEVEMQAYAKHDDIEALKDSMNEKLKFTEEYKVKFDNMLAQLNEKSRISYIDNELRRLHEEKNTTLDHLRVQLTDLQNKVLTRESQFKQLNHVITQWISYINSRFKYYDSKMAANSSASNPTQQRHTHPRIDPGNTLYDVK